MEYLSVEKPASVCYVDIKIPDLWRQFLNWDNGLEGKKDKISQM